ncbi:MAG TPA: ankyrin repeat domain-containing protein [Myxococcaceae bacterium]|nr:ankyrin repeat domain-containing protein [Myxococcaceae bacterium]
MMEVELQDGETMELLSLTREAFGQARSGRAPALEALLACGVPVDIRNEHGDSLLMLAVANGHLEAAQILLEHGADPEITNALGASPIQVASRREDDAMVVLLLESCSPRASAA